MIQQRPSIALIAILHVIYLTGNSRIELNRLPLSWSNLVGVLSVVCWVLTFPSAIER